MYGVLNHNEPFYQGDILQDIPFLIVENYNNPEDGIYTKDFKIMLLSQSCDIQRRKYIIIAPVITIQELERTGESNSNQIRALREQKINYWFYLPEDGSANILPESYVEFTKITHIPRDLLDKNKRVKCLSDLGRHWLGFKLGNFFGRPLDNK